jgi:NADPH-dependent 2,4-dienoyl-CoA reductase/sulfur reductase-like enzyme
MSAIERIVIAGGSLAGLRAAQTLREEAFDGSLTIVSDETSLPYDRPPLSKQVLMGAWQPAQAALEDEETLTALAEWRLGTRATRLDLERREMSLSTGERLPFDRALIATGASPVTLPGTPGLKGIYTLRTMDDCLAIRASFEAGARVAIIGAGFIGCEVAAAARSFGLDVTVLEALSAPLERSVGAAAGMAAARLHASRGVDVRCGVRVTGFEGSEAVEGVRLGDGSLVPADVVVVGVGVRPNTSWLQDSGLSLGDGVLCDQFCRTSDPAVYAAGDVARWYNPRFETDMRVEHWTNAVEQGMAAARNMLTGDQEQEVFAPVPYVWSDQYELSIRFAGYAPGADESRLVRGSFESGEFLVLYRRGEALGGVLAFGMGKLMTQYQRLIHRNSGWEAAVSYPPKE